MMHSEEKRRITMQEAVNLNVLCACVIYFYYYYSNVSKGIARRPTIGSMAPNKQKEVETKKDQKPTTTPTVAACDLKQRASQSFVQCLQLSFRLCEYFADNRNSEKKYQIFNFR